MFSKNKTVKKLINRSFLALGTFNSFEYWGIDEAVADEAVLKVHEIENKMSAFKETSEISKINKLAGTHFCKVDQEVFDLISRAKEFSALSEGAFDITVRPIVALWGIGKKGDFIPSDSEINEALKLVKWQDIILDKKKTAIMLKNKGQCLDLGGIAKGYAADMLKKILLKHKVTSAIINLGGNVATIGNNVNNEPWRIGIQNPLAATGEYLGVLTVTNKTVVTSGCNERFFVKDGIRYHHIINPNSGKPAKSSLLSVTIVGECSADADALTTAMFVLGMEKGNLLLQQYKAEAIFITENMDVFCTENLKSSFFVNN